MKNINKTVGILTQQSIGPLQGNGMPFQKDVEKPKNMNFTSGQCVKHPLLVEIHKIQVFYCSIFAVNIFGELIAAKSTILS